MKDILKGCRQFDRRSQRKMVDYLVPYLTAISSRYSNRDLPLTKDLVQESLINILNNIDKCQATQEMVFKAWCKKVCINTCLQVLRKKMNKTHSLSLEYKAPTTDPIAIQKLHVDDILRLLNMLPEHHRLVFNLAVIDGFKHKEISQILEITESSSRTFLTRAKAKLQKLIKDENSFEFKTNSL